MKRPSDQDASGRTVARTVEAAALRLLARREYSVEELRRRLLSMGHAAETVESVVEKLAGKRLVSDARFTASFVHHHARRGQGPVRIRAELRQQGIPDEQVAEALGTAEVEWQSLAREVRRRKFGAAVPRSLSERAKQARFLQYRGFDAEQIRAAFQGPPGDDRGVTFEAEPVDLDGADPGLPNAASSDPGADG